MKDVDLDDVEKLEIPLRYCAPKWLEELMSGTMYLGSYSVCGKEYPLYSDIEEVSALFAQIVTDCVLEDKDKLLDITSTLHIIIQIIMRMYDLIDNRSTEITKEELEYEIQVNLNYILDFMHELLSDLQDK